MSRDQVKPSRPAVLLIAALIVVVNFGVLLAAEPALTLKVVPERESGIYDVGEEAVFIVTVSRGDDRVTDGSVNFVVDDFLAAGKAAGLPQGNVKLGNGPAKVVAKGRRPEFLRCQVTYTPAEGKAVRASAGVGFSPEEIGLSLPVPDDFDEFWAEQKRQLADVPLGPKLTSVENKTNGVESFNVQVQCLGGAPVSGYFSKPIDAKPKSLPIVLWVHGAGVV
jgi:cephalosporin-C deacetylase